MFQYPLPTFHKHWAQREKNSCSILFQSKATLTGYRELVRSSHGGQSFKHPPTYKMGGEVSEHYQSSQRTMSINGMLKLDCEVQSLHKCVLSQNALTRSQKYTRHF